MNDTILLWSQQEAVQILLGHVNSIWPSSQLEAENDNQLVFLDLLTTRVENRFKTSVYHNPIFTGQYLDFKPHHPYRVKKGIVLCLQHWTKTINVDADTYQQKWSTSNVPFEITTARQMRYQRLQVGTERTRRMTRNLPRPLYITSRAYWEWLRRFAVYTISGQYSEAVPL